MVLWFKFCMVFWTSFNLQEETISDNVISSVNKKILICHRNLEGMLSFVMANLSFSYFIFELVKMTSCGLVYHFISRKEEKLKEYLISVIELIKTLPWTSVWGLWGWRMYVSWPGFTLKSRLGISASSTWSFATRLNCPFLNICK